ncbi:aminofutalosine synthase MqnE [bacterium]|nr:aminofutalosine synthase MqnE [bacterium]
MGTQPDTPLGGFADPALAAIAARIADGRRLDRADGIALFNTPDLLGLGWLANRAREARHGNQTFYNINRHINYSNICILACPICSFSRRPEDTDGQWQYSPGEIFARAAAGLPAGATEFHIVGGIHPSLPFEYYTAMLRGLRERFPSMHLKAFTAVEIADFSRRFAMPVEDVLKQLIDAGLGSMPGGGGEIFNPAIRHKIAPNKIDGETWLGVHRTAHRLGLPTNCSMLYGHVESVEDRVDHLLALRCLQDETGGFQAFIALAFHPRNNRFSHLPPPTGATDLRTIAVSRLLLDNIPHIKAYWVMLGLKTAQLAQIFGADDMDGTVVEETITHMAGGQSPQSLTVAELERLVQDIGRTPVQRDSVYHAVARP